MSDKAFQAQVAAQRSQWDSFAVSFTETLNKRVTQQCAEELHKHMHLDQAHRVLEVAAGAGLGSKDIIKLMKKGIETKDLETRSLLVTDLSPVMVQLARENLKEEMASDGMVQVTVEEANALNLDQVKDGSVDRFVASLCLQLCPNPDLMLQESRRVLSQDGVAGFTIWGRSEYSGIFTLDTKLKEAHNVGDGVEHRFFSFSKDLSVLRKRFAAAGFSKVMIWPFQCVLELWSGTEFASFYCKAFDSATPSFKETATLLGDEWLSKGFPIGLETYIIVARP